MPPVAAPIPPAIKPKSRARIYRIPNTSDHAVASAIEGNNFSKGGGNAAPESFLWATREMAALDFLMNVPLNAEKDIVRAGLSEGRWHRRHVRQQSIHPTHPRDHEDEENKTWSTPHTRSLSAFDISRFSANDDDTGRMSETTTYATESSLQAMSMVSEQSKHQTGVGVGGRWWDKLILKDKSFFSAANQQAIRQEQIELEEKELERPTESPLLLIMSSNDGNVLNAHYAEMSNATATAGGGVPGRRLDGVEAVTITIPSEFRRRPAPLRATARQAAVREWEIKIAYGAQQGTKRRLGANQDNVTNTRQALLDGRMFFSTKKSYPVAVFSTIKYEPKKEETLRRRKQLEELGGGGTQFVLPERDWSKSPAISAAIECLFSLLICQLIHSSACVTGGISYRALLQKHNKEKQNKAFNRLIRNSNPSPPEKRSTSPRERDLYDNASSSSDDSNDTDPESSSDESVAGYRVGFLDDPQMVQGRNRNVMMGNKVTGPIISSTIQFVKPSVLKADLNKQFRERFDQWEPPKSQRKYIGAKIIDGVYTLIDPTKTMHEDLDDVNRISCRGRSGSITGEHERETIRMPPSLTLSKIRR